jgi:hypothetical protein
MCLDLREDHLALQEVHFGSPHPLKPFELLLRGALITPSSSVAQN